MARPFVFSCAVVLGLGILYGCARGTEPTLGLLSNAVAGTGGATSASGSGGAGGTPTTTSSVTTGTGGAPATSSAATGTGGETASSSTTTGTGGAPTTTSSSSSASSTSSSSSSSSTTTSSSSSTSGGISCSHSECAAGPKLSPSCDGCSASVCAQDSYCCATSWDMFCVGEVLSYCGIVCP